MLLEADVLTRRRRHGYLVRHKRTGQPRRVLLLSPKLRWTNEELIIHSSSETHGVCCCCVCSDVFQEDLWSFVGLF